MKNNSQPKINISAEEVKEPPGGRLFQQIRKEKRWSQRDLALRMALSRSHLQRLEEKKWYQITLGEIVCFSEAVAYPVRRLLTLIGLGPLRKTEFARCSQAHPFSTTTFETGAALYNFIQAPGNYHICMLDLAPKKVLQGAVLPKAVFLWGFVNKGSLCLTLEGQEMLFKEREVFHLDPTLSFDFYNPHGLQGLNLLLFYLREG